MKFQTRPTIWVEAGTAAEAAAKLMAELSAAGYDVYIAPWEPITENSVRERMAG